MEKRYVTFFVAFLLLFVTHLYVQQVVLGPKIKAEREAAEQAAAELEAAQQANEEPLAAEAERRGDAEPADLPLAASDMEEPAGTKPVQPALEIAQLPVDPGEEQLVMLGSIDASSPYQMLVTLSSTGASVVRVELNDKKYADLVDESGYLGNLSLVDEDDGVIIRTVGPGTPAAKAGLRGRSWKVDERGVQPDYAGDTITSIDGIDVERVADFQRILAKTRPQQEVVLTVQRPNGAIVNVNITLAERPLQLLQPEPQLKSETEPPHPASFLFTLHRLGAEKTRFDAEEISGIPSLYKSNWSVIQLPATQREGPGVEFHRALTREELAAINIEGSLELVKRYRLATVDRSQQNDPLGTAGYQLKLDVEIRNTGDQPIEVGYQLDGPTGLTAEGWWYSYKVHPTKMSVAGARDVVWRDMEGGHQLFVCGGIASHRKKNPDSPDEPLADSTEPVELAYIGTDAQYFSAVIMSEQWAEQQLDGQDVAAGGRKYDAVYARTVGPHDKKRRKHTDVSCRLQSRPATVSAGESLTENYTVFLGPKEPRVLHAYGLDDCLVYGWFWWVAKPMRGILHLFYVLTGKFSYGVAIILLTVLVRALLYPFGRKMARNAQKMQELAPEMKKIAEKYTDVEKRSKAQQELFKKHNYNPLSGCLVIFIQTPVFLGLYRCIGTDISLRQAPLIPGLGWCSNLAGPDRLWNWSNYLPDALSSTTGWLGPYLNVLPLVAVALILFQQKLFTPPPQDEQQKMQQTVMKFMMVFMGAIFFKFAAGLCLYIIISTIWGLGERILLPKTGGSTATNVASDKPVKKIAAADSDSNGSPTASKRRRKKRKK